MRFLSFWHSKRRLRYGVLPGGAAVLALIAGACVTNPGTFTITAQPDSLIRVTNGNFGLPIGAPACDDSVDSDADGDIDLSDPECDSSSDANERIDGVQAWSHDSIPVQIDSAGVVTGDPTDLNFQTREFCVDTGASGIQCLGVTLVGVGTSQNGQLSPGGIEIDLPIEIELDAITGFTGLPSGCQIGPMTAPLIAPSYDTVTGEAEFITEDFTVPATTTCGTYNGLINGFLGLPSGGYALITSTILDGNGDPIQTSP